MEVAFFERIRTGLLDKRNNLMDFLGSTSLEKQQERLGPASQGDVQAQLEVLDEAIEKATDQTLGICEVCQGYVEPELLEMNYTACVCLDHLSDDEKRELENELELSQTVYRALLPQQIPTIPGVDLAVFSQPAQIVGGDYYDFFNFPGGEHWLVVADVAGHGMSAGLIMASIQTALHTMITEHSSPAEVLLRLNQFVVHNIHFTTFITLFLGHYDPRSRTLTYCNAGHNPPLLVKHLPTHAPAWLPPTGAAVGLVEDFHIGESQLHLADGDVLLLYTDGVTEAANTRQEQFGSQRLQELVFQGRAQPAQDLVRQLRQGLRLFTEQLPIADDTTILAFKVAGPLYAS